MGGAFLAHVAGLRCTGELLWSVAKELVPKALNWLEKLVKAFSLKRKLIAWDETAENWSGMMLSCQEGPVCRLEQSHAAWAPRGAGAGVPQLWNVGMGRMDVMMAACFSPSISCVKTGTHRFLNQSVFSVIFFCPLLWQAEAGNLLSRVDPQVCINR